ncbi:hypothetical protein WJX75_002321 [Coccomyxa subellipsoidea]|uniref:Cellulase n=1 Tax=Coccomyxa subellipsoidea TaxID=248742 RepID=A0ABR2YG87_9CHLO
MGTRRKNIRRLQVTAAWPTNIAKITVEDAYKHWRGTYWRVDDQGRAFIDFDGQGNTVSEATGYGMLISVLMDKKDDYDALLRYYHAHGNHKTVNSSPDGFMKFKQTTNGHGVMTEAGGEGCATDAELDVALSFLLAGQKSDFGDYYLKQGKDLCENILNFCINPDTNMPMLGDWALGETKDSIKDNDPQTQNQMQQRFPNGRKTVSRSTDWMLAHYKQFKKIDTARAQQWDKVFYACIDNYNANLGRHETTGLIADFLYYTNSSPPYVYGDPDGKVLEKWIEDGCFSYNACRVPWKLAAFYKSLDNSSSDPDWQKVKDAAFKMKGFFEDLVLNKEQKVTAGYKLDGTPLNSYEDLCFTAPAWRLLTVLGANDAATQVEKDMDSILLLSLLQTQ